MPQLSRSSRQEQDFGGCRCQALALTGDAAATDPVCHLSPHHYVVVEAREVVTSPCRSRGRREDEPLVYRTTHGEPPTSNGRAAPTASTAP